MIQLLSALRLRVNALRSHHFQWCAGLILLVASSIVARAETPTTGPETSPPPSAQMMNHWLMQQTAQAFQKWEERYAQLVSLEQIAAYQKQQREFFIEQLGGFPERTELNARVTGVVAREGYRVEKVIYESQPGHSVTGLCFVPNSTQFQAPYPAVLVVCGHSENGKALPAYQSGTALLALNGIIGFVIDPVCQGERYEHLKPDGSIAIPSTTTAHSLLGTSAILLGHNTARNEIWDGMRGIDYLQQRDDVQPEKIGCMGNSGGGTQTAYLMALDDRIQAASPSCYITSFKELLSTIGPQDAEQIIHGQTGNGLDHPDYLLMRAPVPILICTATHDFFSITGAWDTFRKAKRIYTRMGVPDRVDLVEVDQKHGWNQIHREAAVRWMCRWLAGRIVDVHEPKLQLLTEDECQVTDRGQVLLQNGARSAFELNTEEYQKLQPQRDELWSSPEQGKQTVRRLAGIRPLAELPALAARKVEEKREGTLTVENWELTPEPGIVLAANLYRPEKATLPPMIWVHAAGKQGEIKTAQESRSPLQAAEKGQLVLAFDLRGTGETAPEKAGWYNKQFGPDGKHAAIAYLLGKNYVGIWAEDILRVARWLEEVESIPAGTQTLQLTAEGRVAVAALHAAALEAQEFQHVSLFHTISSWELLISSRNQNDQFIHCVHGAARSYELKNLHQLLDGRSELIEPIDALGKIIPRSNGKVIGGIRTGALLP